MKIQRIFAEDMRQAIRKVREEHGPEAVILSTKPVEGGVEVISAIDYDERAVQQAAGGAGERGRGVPAVCRWGPSARTATAVRRPQRRPPLAGRPGGRWTSPWAMMTTGRPCSLISRPPMSSPGARRRRSNRPRGNGLCGAGAEG